MESLLTNLLGSSSGLGAYLLVFAVLVACGLGVPLPEDISLVLGGYLVYEGAARLPLMMLVGFSGILVGDSLIFFAGRRLGPKVTQGKGLLAKVITPAKRARVERLFERHGQKIVMIARFMPGVRAVTYFSAGSARMPYVRFLFWDGLAALLSAPLFVWLGYYFGGELELLVHKIKEGQLVVILGLVAVVAAWLAFRYRRRTKILARRKVSLRARLGRKRGATTESLGRAAGPNSPT